MTNLTNIDLSTLNLKNLQALAKEFGVKSWWTMKKAELLEALTHLQETLTLFKEEQKEEEHLTNGDLEEAVEKAAKELGIENPIIEEDPEESTEDDTSWEDEDPNLEQEKKDLETEKEFNGNSKKAKKTKKTKKVKTPKVEKNEYNLVTLKELAAEFHMKGNKARRLLRDANISRPYGGNRWEWDRDLHHDELERARDYLRKHTKKAPKEQDK